MTLRQPATSTFHLQQLPSALAAEAAAADAGPMVPAEASPAAGLELQPPLLPLPEPEASHAAGTELQPLLACGSSSSSPPQRLPPARAGSDWLSEDDDSEASVQLLPPAVPLAAFLVTMQPADSQEFDTPAAAAAGSSGELHALPSAAPLAKPGASYSKALVVAETDSSDAEAMASEPAAVPHITDSSPAAPDALQLAAAVEVRNLLENACHVRMRLLAPCRVIGALHLELHCNVLYSLSSSVSICYAVRSLNGHRGHQYWCHL